MRAISDPEKLESAWNQQYARLSQHFSRMIPKKGIIVEIGCGKGQLTIPLAERIPGIEVIGVDSFRGSYSRNRTHLLSAPGRRGKKSEIKVIVSDYDTWLRTRPDSEYDAVVSSEFLPELDSARMRKLFVECYRVVKLGGSTVHSFFSPHARNARQRRLIEADSDPLWTKTPPAEWFSPAPRRVLEFLKKAGFRRARLIQVRSELWIRSSAARETLRDWDIRQSYWKSHRAELERDGLEVPDWVIIGARKFAS